MTLETARKVFETELAAPESRNFSIRSRRISAQLFGTVFGCLLLSGCAAGQVAEKTIQNKSTKTEELDGHYVRELPESARECLEKLNGTYLIEWRLNPVYQRGKFARTPLYDYAVAVTHKGSGERGIIFCHRGETPTTVLGAGQDLGGGDHLEFDYWRVCALRFGKDSPGGAYGHEMVDTIILRAHDGAPALIYWTGDRYERKEVTDSYLACWD